MKYIYFILIATFLVSCGGSSNNTDTIEGPSQLSPPPSANNKNCGVNLSSIERPNFLLITEEIGLCSEISVSHGLSGMQMMAAGISVSDINNDGLFDIYVSYGVNQKGELFIQNTNNTYSKLENNGGINHDEYDRGSFFLDLNNDGFEDLIIITDAPSFRHIYLNNKDNTFSLIHSDGLKTSKSTYSIAASDYDIDGDLDIYFAHWGPNWTEQSKSEYLFRNEGNMNFSDVSSIVEIEPAFFEFAGDENSLYREFSFTPIFSDLNNDQYPDLLISGDFKSSQYFLNNNGNTFDNMTTSIISDENGMGGTAFDYDNDGDIDWFVSSIWNHLNHRAYAGGESGNRLYRNNGAGEFEDVTDIAGVREGYWGWGSCSQDLNNDGHIDLFHTNGMYINDSNGNPDPAFAGFDNDPSVLFMANGDQTFTEVATPYGFEHTQQGRGVVCFDFDNDGDIDIFIANSGQSPSIYRNDLRTTNNYIQIKLDGLSGNRQSIGAKIEIALSNGNTLYREITSGSNYLSQEPREAHFGLGSESVIDKVKITWPGLPITETILNDITANQKLTVSHPNL